MSKTINYDRNKLIYNEYVDNHGNISMEQIGLKYDISRQQVSSIILRLNRLKTFAGFDTLFELAKYNTHLMFRLYNSLTEWFGRDDFSIYDIIEVDTYEFSKLSSVGTSTTELLVEFKEELKRV